MRFYNYSLHTPFILIILFILTLPTNGLSQDKPNIIWLISEDNSKDYLKLYNENGATMPNVEALAKEGIVFNNAFSNAPVCSVSRSTLISGSYAPRVGTQYHRKVKDVPLPEGLKMFPEYLKEAGYYTTNNLKEDYNFISTPSPWDESSVKASFRNRGENQPFFHVQSFNLTHEVQLHFREEYLKRAKRNTNVEEMEPFPYLPNTALAKFTMAQYLDQHQRLDKYIGAFIKGIEMEGLMDNTFIFYFGDHGGALPRSKGYVYESGVGVPLVVYVPEEWKHLVSIEKGSRTDAFVEFADFAPTVLALAGLEIPKEMDGEPFLGETVTRDDLSNRNTTFSYADRFDEKYDLVRAFRKGKYKYIRNYQPFNIDGLHNEYRYRMLLYQEWKTLSENKKLNERQQQFFERKAPEALYDLEKDPHETNNLALQTGYKGVLKEMRKELKQQVTAMPDLSFYPESYFLEKIVENPVQFGQSHKQEIKKLVDIADLELLSFKKAKKKIKKALKSDDDWKRYWALIVCSHFGNEAKQFYSLAEQIIKDEDNLLVKVRAMEFLALTDQMNSSEPFIASLKEAKTETEAVLILNTVALLKMVKSDFSIQIPQDIFDPTWTEKRGDLVRERLVFINGSWEE